MNSILSEAELEECRRAHERLLLKRREEDRIALAVSRSGADTMEERTRDVYGEQLTFLGLLNDGGGVSNSLLTLGLPEDI